METSALLKKAIIDYKAGNQEAFTTIYKESERYIYTCIYKVAQGNDNAMDMTADVMGDTYLEISQSLSQLVEEDRFLSWAGTIATRKCYAYIKKNKKDILLGEEDDTFDQLADDDNIIPEEVMQNRESQRLLRDIIDKELNEIQKLCIIGFYYNDQKQSEIAEELGIPENTVKTHLSRAKAKIKAGVDDLNLKSGTKVLSVAPLLLLLFKEDVEACEVPAQISGKVLNSVMASAAGASAASAATQSGLHRALNTIIGKIVESSIQAKIIGLVAAVAVVGVGAGTAIHNKNQEPMVKLTMNSEDDAPDGEEIKSNADSKENITITEEQREALTMLAKYSTATSWGENLDGRGISEDSDMIWDFIFRISNDNYEYYGNNFDKYLPAQSGTQEMAYTLDAVNEYSMAVFGEEVSADAGNSFYQDGNLYIPNEAQYPSYDECEITRVDGVEVNDFQYEVTGVITFKSWNEGIMDVETNASYEFSMLVSTNPDSPFGYTFEGTHFSLLEAGTLEVNKAPVLNRTTIADVLRYPYAYPEYYAADTDTSATIYFAKADINGDGQEEVLVADSWYFDSVDRIVNVLGYKDGEIVDIDGDKTYQRLQEWYLFDTGMLVTQLGVGDNQTYYYDLNTGREWMGYTHIMVGGDNADYRTGVKFKTTPEGVELEGEEASNLNLQLTSGNLITLNWMEATEENIVNAFGE